MRQQQVPSRCDGPISGCRCRSCKKVLEEYKAWLDFALGARQRVDEMLQEHDDDDDELVN